jgi:hypothetical protein
MKKLNNLLAIQGILFALMVFVPTFSRKWIYFEIGVMSVEEIMDSIIPFFWVLVVCLLLMKLRFNLESKWIYISFLGLFLILFGEGVHLVGNHFNDILFKSYSISDELKDTAYFYDEVYSHYLIAAGYLIYIISVLFYSIRIKEHIFLSRQAILIAILNGFAFSTFSIEGQVVPLVLPIVFATLATLLLKFRNTLRENSILLYYFSLLLTTFFLLLSWGIINQGFPEFTEVGLL